MSLKFTSYLKEKAGVTEAQLRQLEKILQTRTLDESKILLREGQVCKHFFYVERGLLRFYSVGKKGKEHILEFAPEKWIVSDRGSIYFNEPSKYFIDAIEQTTVAVIDQEFIHTASDISPQFRKYNERNLQNHIRQLQNRINQLIGASAEERYVDFRERYPGLMVRVPQWMIASFLGITPESLSRVRRELAKK
jgi:CRP-like cAMP-binding protein